MRKLSNTDPRFEKNVQLHVYLLWLLITGRKFITWTFRGLERKNFLPHSISSVHVNDRCGAVSPSCVCEGAERQSLLN
jgi:hypothetical protein